MSIRVSELSEYPESPQAATATGAMNGGSNPNFVDGIVNQRFDLNQLQVNPEAIAWLQSIRQEAQTLLVDQELPHKKQEEWKYTDLSAVLKRSYVLRKPQECLLDALENPGFEKLIAGQIVPEAARSLLVFVNGVFSPQLSGLIDLPEGVIVGSLAQLCADCLPEKVQQRLAEFLAELTDADDFFANLNAACLSDVAIAYVPKNVVIDQPIQFVYAVTPRSAQTANISVISQPRCLVVAETGSSMTLVETYVGEPDRSYLSNSVAEIMVGENAAVNHTKVQWEGHAACHISTTAIAQERDSRYTCNAISTGAKISRHNLQVQQWAGQTETHLNGLAYIDGDRLTDTHSAIAHNYAHGSSNQLHKCIVDDRARAIFNGKIQVRQAAQQTDSSQLSRNLLLSDKARVDTKPQLEIVADNVKCAHGATVSQLDADEIFYLQSRGIDAASAANMLTFAFAAEVIQRIPIPRLRQALEKFVLSKTRAHHK
ncbi:Iron-regulated ABC transporter permease protein SufD [Thalassoporum mexicanum PCC 7367]|uniref:Fe-S cluster assembly protein SufD n=1 Tax=Thalassoporum mexicanum TaxID=3457544 RepID=UPI00029FA8BD|nr:Fe-S cluster assembly protein SufD [Pseudanabaena sp. PCC 7367]AFY70212.1 Iron-regulated ABC transporter permease protein SufD [Pseudanabaena sp. PCC 7367]